MTTMTRRRTVERKRVVLPGSRGRRSVPALIGLWLLVIFGGVVPVAVIQLTPVSRPGWFFAALISAASAARFSWLVGNGDRRLFETTFWVFVYSFLGLAPLVQMRLGDWPSTTPNGDWALVPTAFMVVVVGCLAFCVGVYGGTLATAGGRLRERLTPTKPRKPADRRVLVGFAVFALLANLYYLSTSTWLQFTQSRYSETESLAQAQTSASSSTIFQAVAGASLLVSFVSLAQDRRVRRRLGIPETTRARFVSITLMVVVGLSLLNTLNPVSNARYVSATAILGAATALGLVQTRGRYRGMAIAMITGILFVFPFMDAFRYSLTPQFKSNGLIDSLSSPDFDAFAQISNAILYVHREGVAPLQFIGVLGFWMPRRIWPDKPVDTGILLAQERGYMFKNLSAPLWSEFFVNGGWIYLIAGMLVVGFVVRCLDRRIEFDLQVRDSIGVLSCILPFYFLILLRGSLLQATSFFALLLVFTFVVSRRFGGASPPGRSAT